MNTSFSLFSLEMLRCDCSDNLKLVLSSDLGVGPTCVFLSSSVFALGF